MCKDFIAFSWLLKFNVVINFMIIPEINNKKIEKIQYPFKCCIIRNLFEKT